MSSSASTELTKPRILIVEDEVIIAMDIAMQLREIDCEPLGPATRGEQAIELAKQLQPDLVLMDIHLASSMDGITAASAIRSETGTKIVFLSAFDTTANCARAEAIEPSGYINKPFETDDLKRVIEAALHSACSVARRPGPGGADADG
jgi:DNA-binding NarL/FixJ family response regulator